MVWGVFGFGLLNDATSSQASQEDSSRSLSLLCRPHLSFYSSLLMTLSTPRLLSLVLLSFLMPWSVARWVLFIYGHGLSVCVGLSNIHLSCAAIVRRLTPSYIDGIWACWGPIFSGVNVVGLGQNSPSWELQKTQTHLAILLPLL